MYGLPQGLQFRLGDVLCQQVEPKVGVSVQRLLYKVFFDKLIEIRYILAETGVVIRPARIQLSPQRLFVPVVVVVARFYIAQQHIQQLQDLLTAIEKGRGDQLAEPPPFRAVHGRKTLV